MRKPIIYPMPTQQMLDDIGHDPRDGSNFYTRAVDRLLPNMLDLEAVERVRTPPSTSAF